MSFPLLNTIQSMVWKLKRALYGLNNSPRLWQDHFATVMKKINFRHMKSDPNLYVHNQTKPEKTLCLDICG